MMDLRHSKDNVSFRCWYNMVNRPYPNVEVCESWKVYENFAPWFYENFVDGFDLDKDLKVPGSKVYSPHTCMFIPSTLNRKLVSIWRTKGITWHERSQKYRVQVFDVKRHKRHRVFSSTNIDACHSVYLEYKCQYFDYLAKQYPEYSKYILNLKEYWRLTW